MLLFLSSLDCTYLAQEYKLYYVRFSLITSKILSIYFSNVCSNLGIEFSLYASLMFLLFWESSRGTNLSNLKLQYCVVRLNVYN